MGTKGFNKHWGERFNDCTLFLVDLIVHNEALKKWLDCEQLMQAGELRGLKYVVGLGVIWLYILFVGEFGLLEPAYLQALEDKSSVWGQNFMNARWLAPLCGTGFLWRNDCSPGFFLTHFTLASKLFFLAVQGSGALLISNLEEALYKSL